MFSLKQKAKIVLVVLGVKPNSVDPLLCFDDQCLLFICYVLEHFLASDGKF